MIWSKLYSSNDPTLVLVAWVLIAVLSLKLIVIWPLKSSLFLTLTVTELVVASPTSSKLSLVNELSAELFAINASMIWSKLYSSNDPTLVLVAWVSIAVLSLKLIVIWPLKSSLFLTLTVTELVVASPTSSKLSLVNELSAELFAINASMIWSKLYSSNDPTLVLVAWVSIAVLSLKLIVIWPLKSSLFLTLTVTELVVASPTSSKLSLVNELRLGFLQ
ncbi:hypothetical protein NX779_04180 [Mycoplasma cottewii]|uniref:Uncharacterized protein n=1 Tax=Mycoplasma cottewii TaxID=51364 RepID=A0ABY5TZI8_9MOLU|nr:hypothetical protein [Mycoplasma cottewii]UWD34971.1 hypothetical protein NX779_04180 [Mycoplasma cottewii]